MTLTFFKTIPKKNQGKYDQPNERIHENVHAVEDQNEEIFQNEEIECDDMTYQNEEDDSLVFDILDQIENDNF